MVEISLVSRWDANLSSEDPETTIIVQPMLLRRHTDVYRTTTHGLIDCGHLDFNHSKVIELYRCNLSNSDWNPRAGENVAEQ